MRTRVGLWIDHRKAVIVVIFTPYRICIICQPPSSILGPPRSCAMRYNSVVLCVWDIKAFPEYKDFFHSQQLVHSPCKRIWDFERGVCNRQSLT
jgi:hypothetical protein